MSVFALTAFCVGMTVGAYALSRAAAARWRSPLTTPVFFSTPLVIAVLLATGLDLEDYRPAKEGILALLGPATVALAVPLHQNRRALAANTAPAIAALVAGCVSTLVVAVVLARALALSPTVTASISVKSVTAPIAIELASLVNGNPTLTAAFVILTGMMGAMLGPWLMDRVGIRAPLARGLALGAISHGQGTAQAITEGQLQGAAAGVAMGVAAVLTALIAPVLVPLLM